METGIGEMPFGGEEFLTEGQAAAKCDALRFFQSAYEAQMRGDLDEAADLYKQSIEAPRFRYLSGNRVILEDAMTEPIISNLIAKGHQRATQSGASMGGGQAIMIDAATGALMGGSDPRKYGMALGY